MGRVLVDVPGMNDRELLSIIRRAIHKFLSNKKEGSNRVSMRTHVAQRAQARAVAYRYCHDVNDDLLSNVDVEDIVVILDLLWINNSQGELEEEGLIFSALRRIARSGNVKRRTPRLKSNSTPSDRYEEGTACGKFRKRDWESVTVRDLLDWWCWRYQRGFGEEDDAFLRRGALKKHEALVKRYRRELFAGDTGRMIDYLSKTLAWWRVRLRRGARWPTGLPSLGMLLERDSVLKEWRSGAMKRELEAR